MFICLRCPTPQMLLLNRSHGASIYRLSRCLLFSAPSLFAAFEIKKKDKLSRI